MGVIIPPLLEAHLGSWLGVEDLLRRALEGGLKVTMKDAELRWAAVPRTGSDIKGRERAGILAAAAGPHPAGTPLRPGLFAAGEAFLAADLLPEDWKPWLIPEEGRERLRLHVTEQIQVTATRLVPEAEDLQALRDRRGTAWTVLEADVSIVRTVQPEGGGRPWSHAIPVSLRFRMPHLSEDGTWLVGGREKSPVLQLLPIPMRHRLVGDIEPLGDLGFAAMLEATSRLLPEGWAVRTLARVELAPGLQAPPRLGLAEAVLALRLVGPDGFEGDLSSLPGLRELLEAEPLLPLLPPASPAPITDPRALELDRETLAAMAREAVLLFSEARCQGEEASLLLTSDGAPPGTRPHAEVVRAAARALVRCVQRRAARVHHLSRVDLANLRAVPFAGQVARAVETGLARARRALDHEWRRAGTLRSWLELSPSFVDESMRRLGRSLRTLDDLNPLARVSMLRQVTFVGPGGLRQPAMAPLALRDVQVSHHGRLCAVETTESETIGMDLFLARDCGMDERGRLLAPLRQAGGTAHLAAGPDRALWIRSEGLVRHGISEDGRRPDERVLPEEDAQGDLWDDASPEQFLGVAASLIPFLAHDDGARAMMGAKNSKQALPLRDPEPPLVCTGMERQVVRGAALVPHAVEDGVVAEASEDRVRLQDGREWVLPPPAAGQRGTPREQRARRRSGEAIRAGEPLADAPAIAGGELCLGRNLLVAYLPWYGWNFEDAVVVSDRVAREGLLTSLHVRRVEIELEPGEVHPADAPEVRYLHGRARPASWAVPAGGQIRPGALLFETQTFDGRVRQHRAPADCRGRLLRALGPFSPDDERGLPDPPGLSRSPARHLHPLDPRSFGRRIVVLEIASERPLRVGDKLTGRHGNKGVVGALVPEEEMPHLRDGTPIDVLLNPHGVLSRMNVGQLLETHWGLYLKCKGARLEVPPFHRTGWLHRDGTREEVQAADAGELFRRLGELRDADGEPLVDDQGRAQLWDGRTGRPLESRAVIGYQYLLKLDHLADKKWQARRTGPRQVLTTQAVRGRRRSGGQRLGEMEGWALLGYGVPAVIRELLGTHADEPVTRSLLDKLARSEGVAEQDLEEVEGSPRRLPETFAVLLALLRALALTPEGRRSGSWELLEGCAPREGLEGFRLRPALDPPPEDSVVAPDRGGDWLYDPELFGDLSRTRFAWIELPVPVVHPLVLRAEGGPLRARLAGDGVAGTWLGEALETDRQRARALRGLARGEARHLPGDWKTALQEVPAELAVRWVPVLPAGLRAPGPSPLDRLYRAVHSAAHRLARSGEASDWVRLQRAVTGLFLDSPSKLTLGTLLHGKEGLLRLHLLGRRVDYSGRAVIVPGVDLPFGTAGIPERLLEATDLPGRGREDEEPVVLVRPPCLHRMSVQSFAALATSERTVLRLHPLACGGFNADFDGDAMAFHRVHLPGAREEARRMASGANLLSPANGAAMPHLTQDVAAGLFLAGREAVNDVLRRAGAEVSSVLGLRSELAGLMGDPELWDGVLDALMRLGFGAVTRYGLSLGLRDLLTVPRPLRDTLRPPPTSASVPAADGTWHEAARAWAGVPFEDESAFDRAWYAAQFAGADPASRSEDYFRVCVEYYRALAEGKAPGTRPLPGLLSTPRASRDAGAWKAAVRRELEETLNRPESGGNPVRLMLESKARGNLDQVVQLGGMKGLVDRPGHPEPFPHPVESNLVEGLTPLEYFISLHGARKGLVDKKKMTAVAGDLTRRLVEACYGVVVQAEDCGRGENVLTCRAPWPRVCRRCYGPEAEGYPAGIVAAQSIGERGTQLTMQTFHTAGAAGAGSITTAGIPGALALFRGTAMVEGRTLAEHLEQNGPEAAYGHFLRGLRTVYKSAVSEKHFEVVFRALTEGRRFLGLDGAARRPGRGVLSLLSFQRALTMAFAAAHDETAADPLTELKVRLILGGAEDGEARRDSPRPSQDSAVEAGIRGAGPDPGGVCGRTRDAGGPGSGAFGAGIRLLDP